VSKHLFLGGNKDGCWVDLRDAPIRVEILDYTGFHPIRRTYIRCPIGDEAGTHAVYTEKENISRVLELLLEGYNP